VSSDMIATPHSGWLGWSPQGHAASGDTPRGDARSLRSWDLAVHVRVQEPPEMKHLIREWKRKQCDPVSKSD